MALAEAMQLKPAKSKVHQVLDRSFLLVERYDRLIDTQGHRQRLHQEDFCQALGVVPEMKCENEGGPDLAQCFDLARSAMRPSAPQVLRPGGHFKFPHPWPGQNPPLDNGGSGECLRGVSALGNTSGGFLQSPALAVELQQMAVMHQPVQ